MAIEFNVMREQIRSMANDNEVLFASGKGDNVQLGSAGTLGKLFRSASSFVNGAKAFLDSISQRYGDGVRQMAWSMAMDSQVDGKFGLTVGTAKDILTKCEMLANASEELKRLADPNAASVCARVLLDRISAPNANFEKALGEVRVLTSLLGGAKLSPEEGTALGKALKGVAIPSQGAVAMVTLARLRMHPLRENTPAAQLPLLFGVCLQVIDCKSPLAANDLGDGTFDVKNDAIRDVLNNLDEDHRIGKYLTKIAPKLGQLASLAPHGQPTRAMITQVLLDDPIVTPYLDLNAIAKQNFSKMSPNRFLRFLDDKTEIHTNRNELTKEGSRLPMAPANAKHLLAGTIFEDVYKKDDKSHNKLFELADWALASLKSPEMLAQFKIGDCPAITNENWTVDPAQNVAIGMVGNLNFGLDSDEVAMQSLFQQGVMDLCRAQGKGQELRFSVSDENGSTRAVRIGSKEHEGEIKGQLDYVLSRCKPGKLKLMLAAALTQNAKMVFKHIFSFLRYGAKMFELGNEFSEHMGCNVDVRFHKNGSVSVDYQIPRGLEEQLGKLALTYAIDADGTIRTEQFRYELPAAIQQGVLGRPEAG